MNFSEYCALDAVNFSTLKSIDKSPLHYRYAVDVGREDTTGLLKGRATHTAVFEPDEFKSRYTIFPGKRRAGKEWTEFLAAHEGQEILKTDEYEQILAVRDAVHRHPVASKILAKGVAEETIQWRDEKTGLLCKGRLDWFNTAVLADLKGCSDGDARRFGALVARMKYHVQMAWYLDGLNAALDISPEKCSIIAAEINAPHDVAVFTLTDDDLLAGRETYEGWLQKVVECRESNTWPGRFPEEHLLSLPKYIFDDPDQDDATLGLIISDPEEE
jgi:hypothetical protein